MSTCAGKVLVGGTQYQIGAVENNGVEARQIQWTNVNMVLLKTNGIISYIPPNMYHNGFGSAEEIGTCIGFTAPKSGPIKLGLYSTNLQGTNQINNGSILKTITLDRTYSNLMLMIKAEGWISKTPPLQSYNAHVERWNGISMTASIDDVGMNSEGFVMTRETVSSGSNSYIVNFRYYIFMLDGQFSGNVTVQANFTTPTDTNLWVYEWMVVGV